MQYACNSTYSTEIGKLVANIIYYGELLFGYFFDKPNNIIEKYLMSIKEKLDNQSNEQNDKVKQEKKTIIEKVNYLKYADFICQRRLQEGKYINDTLRKLREDIKNITVVKNKSTLYYSPDFVYDCLEDYCISQSDCFSMKSNSQTLEFTCPMIQWVYKRLKENHKTSEYTDGTQSFAKDIIFSIFGVMNITKDKNEPPPIPYVDINELKKHSDNFNSKYLLDSERNYINIHAFAVILHALHLTYLFLKYYKLEEILESETCIDIFGKNINITGNIEQQIIKQKSVLKQLIEKGKTPTNDGKMYSLDDFNNDSKVNPITELYSVESRVYKLKQILSKSVMTTTDYINLSEIVNEKLKTLAISIDSNNAASTIGTLEFIDQFSKLNTTSVLCKTDKKSVYHPI